MILPWARTLCVEDATVNREVSTETLPAGFASLAEPGREGPYISPAEDKQ
jgi:hypothetical protein